MATASIPKISPIVETSAEKAVFSKANWHILPLLIVAYIFAYIDRVNVGLAQIQMKQDLHFSDHVYALGAGLFFVGYILFEVPSNLLLERIGARKTILRIMLCWGACATAMAWVSTPWQFYTLRFLLGAFEAGFFPGCILYFTYWYPAARRGRVISIFMTATVVAGILVGPLNGALMKFGDGFMGLQGWQWIFIVNGAPCLIVAFLCYYLLSDGPAQAGWLSSDEKKILVNRLERERTHVDGHGTTVLRSLLKDPKIYLLSTVYFLILGAVYLLIFWGPTLIQSLGVRDVFHIGLMTAVYSSVGAIGMVLIGRSSDRFDDRRWHFVACVGLIVVCLLLLAVSEPHLVLQLTLLTIMTIGTSSLAPLFFAFVSDYLPIQTAAGGIALVSSVGNIGPAITPSINTLILTSTGSNTGSLLFVAGLYATAGTIMTFAARAKTVPMAAPKPT